MSLTSSPVIYDPDRLIAAIHHAQKRGFLLSQIPQLLGVSRAQVDAALMKWLLG